MIVAALLTLHFLLGGHALIGSDLFAKKNDSVVKQVVRDEARKTEALRTLEQARKQLDETTKRVSRTSKEFQKADEDQAAGRAELQAFVDSVNEDRVRAQKDALDSIFALRKVLTEDEWKAVFAPRGDAAGQEGPRGGGKRS